MLSLAAVVLAALTTYLVLERSHAEEIGTGSRVLADIVRGDRPISPLTWAAVAVLGAVLALVGRGRLRGPVTVGRAGRSER